MEPKIKLELSLNDINVVMAGLGKLPYEAVFTLVETVRKQVSEQLNNGSNLPENELKNKVLPN